MWVLVAESNHGEGTTPGEVYCDTNEEKDCAQSRNSFALAPEGRIDGGDKDQAFYWLKRHIPRRQRIWILSAPIRATSTCSNARGYRSDAFVALWKDATSTSAS